MRPEDGDDRMELTTGLRLAAIALTSAVLTATVVIGAGGAWLERARPSTSSFASGSSEPVAPLIRTSG